ncbi:type III secretion system inner membrane ring subunit SctD [Parachlamydia sp. AcF125]|uniref:type III secretion system inner membrane ring subunit SctD n=1 Tax=Parachlamydia sp. AcF125 TaxID=2795736 RepID=UPI001BCA43AA|nr:type III secretion system inner membrane ring subunit SctD [Parachlamydia sp. AcF125]MBS4168161.1 hypothetical protein [Parachlamydia sp. AcF125]
MSARLIAEDGLLKGLALFLNKGDQWVIGRDPDECQLLVEDPEASGKHAICRKTPEGIILENLSITNPVQINNQEVKAPYLLREGDSIKIGSGTFRFHVGTDSESSEESSLDGPDVAQHVKELKEDLLNEEPEEEQLGELPEGGESESQNEPQGQEAGEGQKVEIAPQEEKEEIKPLEPSEPEENREKAEGEESESQNEPQEQEAAEDQKVETTPQEEKEEIKPLEPSEPEENKEETVETPMSIPNEVEAPINEEEKLSEHLTSSRDDEGTDPFSADDTLFEEEEGEELAEINFGLEETGRWMLKVVGGPNNGAEFSLQPSHNYIIGTDPNACDVVFHDTSVSRSHAKITLDEQEHLFIEDLKSRNGTLVDGEPLKERKPLQTNVLVTMGTTSFIIFDREGEMHTIISPLLPSIVKVLQKEEPLAEPIAVPEEEAAPSVADVALPPSEEKKLDTSAHALSAFILIAIITGLFALVGMGIATLFQSKPVERQETADSEKKIAEALAMFPGVKYSFNTSTGRLLLVGHVLTAVDRNQLLYNLQGLPFIKSLDDTGIVIDEYVWKEVNQVLSRNPLWKGVTVYAPTPGHFVLSGYLKTRKQAEQLSDSLSSSFPYLDLLEKKVVVEEDVVSNVLFQLQGQGLRDVKVSMQEGQLTLGGNVDPKKLKTYDALVEGFMKIPGVRSLQNLVAERMPASAIENITNQYRVNGFSSQGNALSVVINGRILQANDVLDGMTIKEIRSHMILLEKDGRKYQIDF